MFGNDKFPFAGAGVGAAVRGLPRTALLLGGILLGVVLLVMGGRQPTAAASEGETAAIDLEEYARALEERVCSFCEQVEGVGEAHVTVSLESGYRKVYAREGDEYVMVGSGTSRGTLCLTEEPPKIGGIAVVCTGGGDPTVRRRLIGLLCAAYGVGAHQIYIAQAQN